jgi:hypothetical protein
LGDGVIYQGLDRTRLIQIMNSFHVFDYSYSNYHALGNTAREILIQFPNFSPEWSLQQVNTIFHYKNLYPQLGRMIPEIMDPSIRKIMGYTEKALDILVYQILNYQVFEPNVYYHFLIMMKTVQDYILIQQSIVHCESFKMNYS